MKWIRSELSLSAKLSMSWQVLTMRADVAAKGKARLPFLFLVLDSEQKTADEGVCVGEQHKMHPEQRKAISSTTAFHFHFPSVFRGAGGGGNTNPNDLW